MNWWEPTPSALFFDVRFVAASLAAKGMVLVAFVPRSGRVPVVEADIDRTAQVLGGAEGPAALRELLDAGLVRAEGSHLVLDVAWPELHGRAPAPQPTTDGTSPPRASSPEAAAPTVTRTKPSDSPEAVSLRAQRSHFNNRTKPGVKPRPEFRDAPPGSTFEAWLASPPGQAWQRRRDERARGCNAPASPATPPCNAALQTDCNAPATPPPPHTPSPQRNKEIETHTEGCNAPATPPAATPGVTLQRPGAGALQGGVAACASVEHLGVDPEAALLALRSLVGKRMNLAHDVRSLSQWAEVVRGLPSPTLAAFELLGEWVAAGAFDWRQYGRPSLGFLLQPGRLAELLDEASTWQATGRPSLSKRPAAGASSRPSTSRVGPARASTSAEAAADAAGPDPLAAYLHNTGS